MVRDINPEKSSILTEKVPAIVVDNDDPEQAGRVKIRIPPIHKGINKSELPWAKPVRGPVGAQTPDTEKDIGDLSIPAKNTYVAVTHHNGDPNQPMYFHSTHLKETQPKRFQDKEDDVHKTINENRAEGDEVTEQETELPDYPTIHGQKWGPIVVELDYGDSPKYMIYMDDARFEILSDGTMVQHTEGKSQNISMKNREIYVGETLIAEIEKNGKIFIGENRQVEIDKNDTIKIGEDREIEVEGKKTVTIGETLRIDAGDDIRITTAGGAEIRMSGNRIDLNP